MLVLRLVTPFFSEIGWIGAGNLMLDTLPGHPQPAEGQPNGFVAEQPRREALGETDLGGEGERPPTGGLAQPGQKYCPSLACSVYLDVIQYYIF